MPVVLNANNAQDYLETKNNNLIFDNFEDVDLNFSQVSKYVNNPKNNDEKCLQLNVCFPQNVLSENLLI